MSAAADDDAQIGLPGLVEPARPLHRLFFALLPEDDVREKIAGVAAELRDAGSIQARWVNPERYHVTLAFLGDHLRLRDQLLEDARGAASRLTVAPFTWKLDQVSSFKGRRPPCVLRSAQVSQPLQTLWEQLRRELAMVRLGKQIERNFSPHITLAYGQGELAEPVAVTPVAWPVSRVVLLRSEVGSSQYEELGSWMLPG